MLLPSVLLIDASTEFAAEISAALSGRARVDCAPTLQQGLELLQRQQWTATILSLDLPAADMALVERLVGQKTGMGALVLVASRINMQMMVAASRLGVLGVVSTPLAADELLELLEEAFVPAEQVIPITEEDRAVGSEGTAIGTSPAMLSVFRTVGRVAASPATVLILGESGTGKELVARAIHANSDRTRRQFVAINCAAIPENLLESELFGHEKGAFTGAIARKIGRFERADGGTLLLDEIGDMSIALQSKILRTLQEREIERVGGEDRIPVNVRVIAATNKDLRVASAEGTFREDLYFRLAVVTLQLPPLRDRGPDLDLLIRYFVAEFASYYGREVQGIAQSVLDRLRSHAWPGNVRELKNVLERAVLLSQGPVLRMEHLPLDQLQPLGSQNGSAAHPLAGYTPTLPLAEVEKMHIREVLNVVDGHLGRAAEVLGIHRNTLTRKLQEYGLASRPSPF